MMESAPVVRALKRLVYTDKLLTMEDAFRYCDVAGIPREAITKDDARAG